MPSGEPLIQQTKLLRRIWEALSQPLEVFRRRRVDTRMLMNVQANTISGTAIVSQWIPVQKFDELILQVFFNNPSTGSIVAPLIQVQILDPFGYYNGQLIPTNLGAAVAIPLPAAAATFQSVLAVQLTNFGAWIRVSVTSTGASTLSGTFGVSMQGKQ